MNDGLDKCKWCGLSEVDDGTLDTVFACGSSWRCQDMWFQSTGCEEVVELRKRVATAIAAIEAITTYRLEKDDHGAWLKGASDGIWMDRLEVENVKKILQGNNPEIPEGSA